MNKYGRYEYLFCLTEDKTAKDIKKEIDDYVLKTIEDEYIKYLSKDVALFCGSVKSKDDYFSFAEKFYKAGIINVLPNEFLKIVNSEVESAVNKVKEDIKGDKVLRIAVAYSDFKKEKYETFLTAYNMLQDYFDKDLMIVELSSSKIVIDRESAKNLLSINGTTKVEFDSGLFADNGTTTFNNYHTVTLNEAIRADSKASDFIGNLQKLSLSPFEKYLLIHDYCAKKAYLADENSKFDPRKYVDCMNSNQIVCVGYARMMEKLCKMAGIQCEFVSFNSSKEAKRQQELALTGKGSLILNDGHAFNIVKIKDDKYNIDSTFMCDACWDSIRNGDITYLYATFPLQDVCYDEHKDYLDLLEDKQFVERFASKSQIIPLNTYRKALKNAYKEYDGGKTSSEIIEKRLNATIKNAKFMSFRANNCFASENKERSVGEENIYG